MGNPAIASLQTKAYDLSKNDRVEFVHNLPASLNGILDSNPTLGISLIPME